MHSQYYIIWTEREIFLGEWNEHNDNIFSIEFIVVVAVRNLPIRTLIYIIL